ncbi:MAG: hypothetical protein K2J80_08315 [Oscillospiraceae bacterium]|nr:hypothetical protein [Oscillospiraceae bacterium]
MKKRSALLILVMVLLCTGCARQAQKADIADKTYVYEKDGFGGDFTIKLNGNGTFTYYEGALSSYIGMGNWTFDGETLVLSDNKEYGHTLENRFKIVDGDLVFQAESSSNFTHIKAADGEKFSA